jgi:hypothetical protein
MATMSSGLTDAQALAVAAVLTLASPEFRGGVEVAISTALTRNIGGPAADSAVLTAIGAALTRYYGA